MFRYSMEETIGQQLKQAREARNLTYKKVTQATHIQARLIEAMEADDFEALPSPMQARAFLRLYADYLELSLDDLIARQRSSLTQAPPAIQTLGASPQMANAPQSTDGTPTIPIPDATGSSLIQKTGSLVQNFRQRLKRSEVAPPRPERQEIHRSAAESVHPAEVEPKTILAEEPTQKEAQGGFTADEAPARKSTASQIVFASIGEALHQRRETLSLTVEEVENHIHVRKHYLQALEAGDFDHLPSSVQTRGMLSNYAHFLDMDVDALLLQFAEGLQAQRVERQPVSQKETPKARTKARPSLNLPPALRNYLSLDVFVGAGLIIVLLGFAIWGTSRIIGLRSAVTPQATAESISDILAAAPQSGTPTETPTKPTDSQAAFQAANATLIITFPAAGDGPVQVVVVAVDQAYVRVTVDGKKIFDGRVAAGTVYPFDGNSQIEVLTGNGAAISVLFNKSDLGPMGSIGEVVNRIYTTNAILNPTATSTPTATITPIPSATPRVSPTVLPSSVPAIPKATGTPN